MQLIAAGMLFWSALLFELWAWTVLDFIKIQSELTVGIQAALKEAGIGIPFPQRDVHIKTSGSEAGPAASELGPADGDERSAPQ